MAILRFQVRTFRGLRDCVDYASADTVARAMIQGIKEDDWCDDYWWAEIYDRYKCRSRILWLRGHYMFLKTQWLHLR